LVPSPMAGSSTVRPTSSSSGTLARPARPIIAWPYRARSRISLSICRRSPLPSCTPDSRTRSTASTARRGCHSFTGIRLNAHPLRPPHGWRQLFSPIPAYAAGPSLRRARSMMSRRQTWRPLP
jgi:hypothetical protein